MKPRALSRAKGRRSSRGFSMLVHDYFTSAEYAELSPRAVKALIDLYTQFRGSNNGDLCASWSLMARLGWSSKDQLQKALAELLERRWIIVTRQGGRRIATLYAVTFLGIDPCGGKLEVTASPSPLHLWRRPKAPAAPVIPLPRTAGQCAPHGGSKDERAQAH